MLTVGPEDAGETSDLDTLTPDEAAILSAALRGAGSAFRSCLTFTTSGMLC